MKIIVAAFLIASFTAFAQQGERNQKVIEARPQPAQTVSVQLTAEAATALESLRLSTPGERDANGVSKPQFATIQELWLTLTRGILLNAVQRFPPASIKAAQQAAVKARTDAEAAANSAVTKPDKPK